MEDTIAAIATLVGESSVNIIRISGSKSIEIVNKIFSKNLYNFEANTINYGFIVDKNEKIDEVLVSIFKSPKSFTTEDVVEINSHGGIQSVNRILQLVLSNGARLAQPGEFLKRAFLNNRIDLIEAESVSDLINSKTEMSRKMAINGINRELSNKIKKIKDKVVSLIANIEVNIDYPEYEDAVVVTKELIKSNIGDIEEELNSMIKDSDKGMLIKNGIKVSIVGKPNVGKSSLLNALIDEEKAIVTDIKGTTRDIVEGNILIEGINVEFLDTAGIRKTSDIVESIGVKKSIETIDNSDLVIFVIDSSSDFDEEDRQILHLLSKKKVLIVYNKKDINKNKIIKEIDKYSKIRVSTYNKNDISNLKSKISDIFNLKEIENSNYEFISNARQIALMNKCINNIKDIYGSIDKDMPVDMIEIDIKELYNNLNEITGESFREELLDEIFSKFCLGK